MPVFQKYPGSPWLYDVATGDIVGVKDPDGSEQLFARIPLVGAFHSEAVQTASVNTATALQFATTDISHGITVVGGTQITVPRTAVYNVQFSAQYRNTAGQEATVDIWFRINGANVANSNTRVTIPKQHAGGDGYLVAAWNIFLEMNENQNAQIMWSTPDSDVSIYYTSGLTSPTRPDIPSVIVTVNEVDGSYAP
jgi:hypothetical protein